MHIGINAILILLISCFAGQRSATGIRTQNNLQKMKASVLEKIPIGSDLQSAEKVMQDSGFDCKIKRQSSFVEYLDPATEKVHEREDFLWCHKSKRIAPLTLRRWQVIIVLNDDIVSEVYISSGIVAP